jgi:hypothetical protein
MSHEYTRQRQGRDFPLVNYLRNAEMGVEGNYNNIDGIIDDTEQKKTLHERLEHFKAEAERQAVPTDGNEPVTERAR